jgi:VWFA-related protein
MMRGLYLAGVGLLLGALLVSGAQGDGGETAPTASAPRKYTIEVDPKSVVVFRETRDAAGERPLYVTAQFKIVGADNGGDATDVTKEDIVVTEEGKPVADLEILQPRVEKLTTVLAMDISGSMQAKSQAGRPKIDEAKDAARIFLDSLHDKADTGLILFDHLVRLREAPGKDVGRFAEHRKHVRQLIDAAKPSGGTAYLDAASEAIKMIKPYPGRRAVLVMTDGVDMNSTRTLDQVIRDARTVGVPVYTVGIGEPGKKDNRVTTVLVLDHSGSMKAKASTKDQKSKIEALHRAASRFVEMMPANARTTLLPFSTTVERPQPFTDDKGGLKARIAKLRPEGGTLLYDATLAGIETVLAAGGRDKKAVVVLTDGKDEAPGSRHSDQGVIDRAKEAGVPLYMLGLGRPDEINEAVMRRMASETGGAYYHAGNEQELIDLFEKLSIDIHDEGIDEAGLRKLAEETGGKYYHARDASELRRLFQNVSTELQSTYTMRYRSPNPDNDGTARGIDIRIYREGQLVSEGGKADVVLPGVVVPKMDHMVYLGLLGLLAGLLVAPAAVRRLYKAYGGA